MEVTEEAIRRLLDESEIRRVLNRYVRSVDRQDLELMRSCYHADATDTHGVFRGSRDEFIAWVGPLLKRYTMAMHHLTNVIVDVDGDDALVESYAVSHSYGEPATDTRWNNASGFRYIDHFQRRDGEWKIADRVCALDWVEPWLPDSARMAKLGLLSRNDQSDVLYEIADRLDPDGNRFHIRG